MAEQYIGGRVRLDRRVLKGDVRVGVPELWQASDAGDVHYVKLWRRPSEDRDIRALWNREVRGLMRLQGHPGASELFVRLEQLGIDEKHYFAILEGGQRQPLAKIFEQRRNHPWLGSLREVGRRRVIWDGLLRIAEGLAMLHRDGTLHRSLGPHSVFVGPEGADFRLSGFEWSLRVAGVEGAAAKVAEPGMLVPRELEGVGAEYSTASDWFAFGVLAAEVFGLSTRSFRKRGPFRAAVERLDFLNATERDLILGLIAEDASERLFQESGVLRAVRDVVRSLNQTVLGANRPLVLAVRLGPLSSLAQEVEVASGRSCLADNPQAQLDWIREDLRGDFRVVARNSAQPHYVLRGAKLEYRVRPWNNNGASTWDIGYCDAIEAPYILEDDQTYSLGQRKLEFKPYAEVRTTHRAIRDRAATWDKLLPFARSRTTLPAHLRDVHDFFRITQQLDVVLTAATICPVEIRSIDRARADTTIEVSPFDDSERTDLAQFLELGPPAEQVREWFALGVDPVDGDDEDDPERDRYYLLDRRIICRSAPPETSWTFAGAKQTPRGPLYRFRCRASPPLTKHGRMFLARNFGGTIAQIRRRHTAIENLRNHEALLRMIDDPAGASRRTDESLPPERSPIPLDKSKRDALDRLWRSEPSFAVQGPPGTGKTTLIKAFADRLLGADPSSQVLITAHSHHTVDDVLGKLAELFADDDSTVRPILVRLGTEEQGQHDPETVTRQLLRQLETSELAVNASPTLRKRLLDASRASRGEIAELRELSAMRLLVQDAANVTFVTSNSPALADLSDRGRRFDWSVIEEAGKAHGFDMALALQESHRVVLIGDHRQLPPFNVHVYTRLLEDALRVREAIRKGAPFAPTLIDPALVDEEEGRLPLAERCQRWRGMVEFFGRVFEESTAGRTPEDSPAAMLVDQHRMHPDIAKLVGRAFYPTDDGAEGTLLNSPEETRKRFERPAPFRIKAGSWLPDERIVWCDLDWVQKREFARGETSGLFEAPAEADTLLSVLQQFEPAGERCELQILSPYNGQLSAIRKRLEARRRAPEFALLFESPFDLRIGKRMGATVDEFQGSEADIVVASLVRNNGLPARQSLGFLRQPNRLNVLLSRARHKLIIVGSWDFFASRCDSSTGEYEEHAYIARMMDAMERALQEGHLARIRVPS